jgi:BlaR1 peptidase M56.
MVEIFMKELLCTSLVGSLGIIVIIFLQKTLFKRYTHAFCYYIWLAVVIRMIVPFKIPIYLSQEVYKFFWIIKEIRHKREKIVRIDSH